MNEILEKRDSEERNIKEATHGTGVCPMCGGREFVVEGPCVICSAPGICTWSKEVD